LDEAGSKHVRAAAPANKPGADPQPTASAAIKVESCRPPARVAKRTFKRRSHEADEDLRKQLVLVPEVGAAAIPFQSRQFLAQAPKDRWFTPEEMPDFAGLPMRMGVDCQRGKEAAENLQVLSRELRTALAQSLPRGGLDPRPNAAALRERLLPGKGASACDWTQSEALPTLRQLLMAENKPVRLLLVDVLARITDRAASTALAERALFDLSAEVREAAVQALRERPRDECRAPLLDGLRYPWAPVAYHAAEALIALEDRGAVPALTALLEEPDPAAPFRSAASGTPSVRELVRINHFANCTLCHAQSNSANDPVRGLVPAAGQPLPPPASSQYYEGSTGMFVRADVTYLQQDFSVPQPVANPGAWPVNQRYDYLVRTRSLTTAKMADLALGEGRMARWKYPLLRDHPAGARDASYDQRNAVLFALQELKN
jgi:hypothetical protein